MSISSSIAVSGGRLVPVSSTTGTSKLYDIPKVAKADWTICPSDENWFYRLSESLLWTANNATLLPLVDSLVAYWKGEDLTDEINRHTLTNNNVVTFTGGKNNNAFTFNGVNQYMSNATNPSDFAVGTGDYTVSFWMYDTSFPDSADALYATTTSGGISCTYTSETLGIGRSQVADDFSITHGMSTSTWHLVVISRISGTVNIYIDGVSKGSKTLTINYPSSAGFNIGVDGNSSSLPASVSIDEFAVWKGHGMTQAEVTALHNSGTGAFLL